MEEKKFRTLKEEYYRFRENFEKEINNTKNLIGENDCFIIDDYWNKQLVKCFKRYDDLGTISLPKTKPDFINDNNTLINSIRNKIKFKLINKEVIYSIYERKELKLNSFVNYYIGNGKLIIEYKDIKEDSILLINPLEEEQNENNIFLFLQIDQIINIIYIKILL